jgi:hypothetical protein
MPAKSYVSFLFICSALIFTGALKTEAQELPADFDMSRILDASYIPQNLTKWLWLEQNINDRHLGTYIKALDHSALDRRFDPKNQPVFEIGYLEIPNSEARFRLDPKGLSPAAQAVQFFTRDGVTYQRFFIHPLMEDKYQSEAKLWGEAYTDSNGKTKYRPKHGPFIASLTSSLRSFVVWNREHPEEFIGEKVSLAVVVQVDRKNDIDKLERAYAINQVMAEIPTEDKAYYHFDTFREPMIQNTAHLAHGGKHYGNIVRDFDGPMVYPSGAPKYIPGFALTASPNRGSKPILIQMIEQSGLSPSEFIQTKVIKPLIQAYAYLTFKHGIVGEPHQQNLLYELSAKGELTGKVIFRDLDAFKPDIELRHLLGLSDEPFVDSARPFKLLKMSKAQEFYKDSYVTFVRGVWSENIAKMMFQWLAPGTLKEPQIAEMFDQALAHEIVDHLGPSALFDEDNLSGSSNWQRFVKINRSHLQRLLSQVNWTQSSPKIDKPQSHLLLNHFSIASIFEVNPARPNSHKVFFDPNKVVENYKKLTKVARQNGVDQNVLRTEYERLTFNYRQSVKVTVPRNGYFVLNHGSISAFRQNGAPLGHVFLEPRAVIDSDHGFYEGSRYPRVEPNKAVLAMLYDYADGKISQIPAIDTHRYIYPVKEEDAGLCSELFSKL